MKSISGFRKKCSRLWQRVPLNKKFTVGIIAVLILPIAAVLLIVFSQIESYQVERIASNALNELKKTELTANTNADIASAVIQTIKANPQILDSVSRDVPADELVLFNRQVTPYIENIVITNPTIRSIRVYCDSERMPERWPVFISSARVANESWYNEVGQRTIYMRLDYSEQLSQYAPQLSGDNIISFSSALNNDTGTNKAIIEISFYMDTFLGEAYLGRDDQFCFLFRNEQLYISSAENDGEAYDRRLLAAQQIAQRELLSSGSVTETIEGTKYLITSLESKALGGQLIMVNDLTDVVGKISQSRMFLIVVILALIILLTIIYERIASVLLKRIYQTISAMRSLEEGNTRVKIENPSRDEIGQLQYYFNKLLDKIDDLVDQNSKRSLLEKDAEIKALQNQINAHFLYNVLNNIEMMAVIDENYLIADTATALGRLLRYSMNWKSQIVALSGEINYVRDYVQLFNIRFDNKIQLLCEIGEEVLNAQIPKMSVQPIVENAIVHGIESTARDAVIKISAVPCDGILTLKITDSGSGINAVTLDAINDTLKSGKSDANLTGIGLKNVQERIELHFGADQGYGLTVTSMLDKFTEVTIKMPFRSESLEKRIDS